MSTSQDKIITKLHERRQIEAGLRQMLAARSDLEFRRQAQQIAALGPEVIPAIVGNLERADAQMLVAMGVVATFLDPDEVTAALRQAILQPHSSDRGRIGAMTILERFFDLPPDDDLLASLRDPEAVAIASLNEVLDQVDSNPAILVEYVQGLDRQEPDVVLSVVRALRGIGSRQVVEPLRMMAQDVRDEIAAEAMEALGALRLSEAVRALQMLGPVAAPELRPLAERLVRKMRFAGVAVEPLPTPDPAWRALVSPLDRLGQQSVWFIQMERQGGTARFLNVLLSDRAGAVEALGHRLVPLRALPLRRPVGYVHDIVLPDDAGAMLMLEIDFDLGRRLVAEALSRNRETQIPVAGVLRLFSSWLWDVAGGEGLPPRILPDLAGHETMRAETDRLLAHPAFAAWTARSEAFFQVAESAARHSAWDQQVWVRRLAGEIFGEPVVARVFSQRLENMSEWLWLSGEQELARLALIAARALLSEPPQAQPFILALVRRDLELTLHGLQENWDALL